MKTFLARRAHQNYCGAEIRQERSSSYSVAFLPEFGQNDKHGTQGVKINDLVNSHQGDS
jgi:hypothetical protein